MSYGTSFTARVLPGDGRGRGLGSPTFNLDTADVPKELEEGVYATQVKIDQIQYPAVMHYGLRPTFHAKKSCEIHILHRTIEFAESIFVEVAERLRDVHQFASPEELKKQIAEDIDRARGIL